MLSAATIRHMADEAAERTERLGIKPQIVSQSAIDHMKRLLSRGEFPHFDFPFVGSATFKDYKPVGEPLFVDSSGFGDDSEPALTVRGFVDKLQPGLAYAVVEAGQFQVFIQAYKPKNYQRLPNISTPEETEVA